MVVLSNISNKTNVNSTQKAFIISNNNQNLKDCRNDTLCVEENTADKILKENRKQEEDKENEKGFYKYANIGLFSTLATVIGSEFYYINKIKKSKLKGLTQDEINKISKNALKKSGIVLFLAITTWVALSSYFYNKREKYAIETSDYFKNINNTGARLAEKEFNSMLISAFYNGASGEIYLNKNNLNDPWSNYKNKFTIKHELVHAKQYETVARMNDGVRKLNYAMFKNDANRLKKDATQKQMISDAYNDIISDKTSKYEKAKFSYSGYEIPFKDYIIAMYKLINDKEKNYADIPMLINAEHYNSVRDKFGALTPEEEQKATEYYNGILNYVPADSISALSPFSEYRKGILEKEAYKENPWYTMFV